MDGTWFGEVSFCCCLPVLPGFAWVLLNKFYHPFFSTLYMKREIMWTKERFESERLICIDKTLTLSLPLIHAHVSKPKHAYVRLVLKGHDTLSHVTLRDRPPLIGGYESPP